MTRMLRLLCCLFVFLSLPPVVSAAGPLTPEGKLVLAHYMTKMVPGVAGEQIWADPALHDAHGRTSALGGLYLTLPMWAVLRPKMSLEEAVEFEIRCARQMGVDGFQFYYPFFKTTAPLHDYNRIVRAFVRAAEKHHPAFKIALCLSLGGEHPELKEAQRVEIWGSALKELLDDTAASPAWLRTRQGALLFYHWATDGFADGVGHMAASAEEVEKMAAAFERLAGRSGHAMNWVFHVRRTANDPVFIEAILKHFPAVWGWVEVDDDPVFWDDLARRCSDRGVAYTQTVYPDYFTSKVYALGDRHYRLLTEEEALKLGTRGIERHYRQTDLVRGQSNLLQTAIDRRAQIINYATWNDWPEGQHLAPEASRGFGPSMLLRHFAALWRGEPSPVVNQAAVFYKRHRSTAMPAHEITVQVKSRRNEPSAEDEMQVISFFPQPVRCELNGSEAASIPAGFQLTRLPLPVNGAISLRFLAKDGQSKGVIEVPDAITEKPIRTDRLTRSATTSFRQEFRAMFGDVTPVLPVE